MQFNTIEWTAWSVLKESGNCGIMKKTEVVGKKYHSFELGNMRRWQCSFASGPMADTIKGWAMDDDSTAKTTKGENLYHEVDSDISPKPIFSTKKWNFSGHQFLYTPYHCHAS